jgi:hypothetical protein
MSVSAELQKLVFERLKAVSAVTTFVGNRIYDHVPPNAEFPYISFGSHDFVPDDADCIFSGEHTLMLDAWSRKPGRVEAKQIVDEVRRALRLYEADMGDYGLVQMDIDFADVIRDGDGATAHGRIQIRALIEEPE